MREKSGPKFVQYFNSVLNALKELGGSGRPSEIIDYIATHQEIDETENELLSDGSPRLNKNINWARFYLSKVDFIDGSKRGVWSLTEKGNQTTLNHKQSLEIFNKVHKNIRNKKKSQKYLQVKAFLKQT